MSLLRCLVFISIICYSLQVDILGCGGFVKSDFPISYSKVEVKLYTKQGSLKYQTECAPNNGYYLIPLYDKGDYILKVEPPKGWSFDPMTVPLHINGETDPCSQGKDIDFIFKGFSIAGKVTNRGQNDGPSGVIIELQDTKEKVIQTLESQEKGDFAFENILPGKYIVKAKHPRWLLDNSQISITVDKDNVQLNKAIVVGGYDVQGEVQSEGEAIQGVHFLLFNENKLTDNLSGCDPAPVKGFKQETVGKLKYICRVSSTEKGTFKFPALPPGKFTLVPFYKGEHTEFEVSPSKVDFEVGQGSVEFPNIFQVQGFSVSGKVLRAANGEGLAGAKIYLDNKEQITSQANGWYYLDNMRAGVYKLEVKMDNIGFRPLSVKITPNSPQLPDIVAATFEVCGQLQVSKPFSSSSRQIAVEEKATAQIPVNSDGSFCQHLVPGNYKFTATITPDEKKKGLRFIPSSQQIKLGFEPIKNIKFNQFFATIKGKVKCIQKCTGIAVQLFSAGKKISQETVDENTQEFVFNSVLPGQYDIVVHKNDWCFKSTKLSVSVGETNVDSILFEQTGFQVNIELSHGSLVKLQNGNKEETKTLVAGPNNFCVSQTGIHTLTPIGCHKFGKNSYTLETSKSMALSLKAVEHQISGSIISPINVTNDISLDILKQEKDGAMVKEQKALEKYVASGDQFIYEFVLWAKPKTFVEVLPLSKTLLFQPTSSHINMLDDCQLNAIKIKGQMGLFIRGTISPRIEGVELVIKDPTGAINAQVKSDKKGEYVVGPLDGDIKYSVEASKEGYVFKAKSTGKQGDFDAFKLAEVLVQVVGENSKPLSGVLLSLSGGVDYRKNSVTRKDGKLNFTGLSPGQYFLRSVLKEYKFEPTAQMIEVKEGGTVPVQVKGKRVAFSCFGQTNSLTGEAESGIAIEAIGKGNCSQFQEEAISEQDGSFRIRGLLPNCIYQLRLKPQAEGNSHIERSVPKQRVIEVINGDLFDQRMIIMRKSTQMDVIGIVNAANEHLPLLKVRLYKKEGLEGPVKTFPLTNSFFFSLPMLPIDNTSYTVVLEGPQGSSTAQFQANTSFQILNFEYVPRPHLPEQEITHGSLVALPLTILLGVILYNYSLFLPYLTHVPEIFQSAFSGSSETSSASEGGSSQRRKSKPRKA